MIFQFSFKHMEPSDSLRRYAEEKSAKLSRYFEGKIHLTWTFEREHGEFIAHCHLLGNHMDYFGEGRADEAYATVDLTVMKLEKQVKKHKEILTGE